MARLDNMSEAEFMIRYSSSEKQYFKSKQKKNPNFYKEVIDAFISDHLSYSSHGNVFAEFVGYINDEQRKYLDNIIKEKAVEFSDTAKTILCNALGEYDCFKYLSKESVWALIPDYRVQYHRIGFACFRNLRKIFSTDKLFSEKKSLCNDSIPFTNVSFQKEIKLHSLSDRALINIYTYLMNKAARTSAELRMLEDIRKDRSDIYSEIILNKFKSAIAEKIVSLPSDIRNDLLDIIDINTALSEKLVTDVKLYFSLN